MINKIDDMSMGGIRTLYYKRNVMSGKGRTRMNGSNTHVAEPDIPTWYRSRPLYTTNSIRRVYTTHHVLLT
jgi:hypothetical protein